MTESSYRLFGIIFDIVIYGVLPLVAFIFRDKINKFFKKPWLPDSQRQAYNNNDDSWDSWKEDWDRFSEDSNPAIPGSGAWWAEQ